MPRGRWAAVRLGFPTQLANPKVAIFFGSIFVVLLPPDPPAWMIAALLVIVFLRRAVLVSLRRVRVLHAST